MMGVLVMKLKRGKKRSCAYLVRYALRARRATKALRCFTILTLTLFLRCIFQIPPLRQPKDSGQRKNARGMSARRVITMSVLFRHAYLQSNRTPPAPVNLWAGGCGCRLVLAWVDKLRSSVTRFYAARLAARSLFFQLTSRLRVVLPTQLLTLT